ncbi:MULTISPECIES: TonB-dependent receptor domain-containing protein [Brevundimonas]|uniref:TonB-dependent receptor domain-containing protein n=1 Tax=Brevundimonas TaxID=41275 RepID=UPI001907EB1F|nr:MULTISPECIES: TonB-dependent receptor [Brevundimonas]MBK1967889.1 TonB-dependent receptor [Brevundimonas diminuta]MBK1974539.1 TonB-dependent receptor [Brevundimonas diminuta]
MRLSAYLKTGTIIAGLAVTAAAQPGWAQSEAPAAEPEASAVADIVVTGSRIRRPNVEASTPVNVVDAQEIENIGVTNLIDAMARQPQVGLGASASSTTNTVAGQGLATLNLRNLGASRTLVLVNGRRHVAGSSGTSAVDVNTISKTTIARVDTVTGGSSAVYGADAVAGVVNFITKQDFDGIAAQAQYGSADGPNTYYGSVAVGRNFNDGRTNIMAAATYDKTEGLYRHERDYAMSGLAYIPNPDKKSPDDGLPSFITARDVYTNITNDSFTPVIVTPIGSNAAYSLTFTEDGRLVPFDRGQIVVDGAGRPQKVSIGGDGFKFREDALRTPVERYGGELQLRHQFQPSGDFISELNLFAEGKYFHTEANSQRENGTFAGDVAGTATGNAYRIQADNAFLPSDLRAMLTAAGVEEFDITRNDRDFGIRTYESVYDTTRFVAGFDGAFSNGWRFETYINYGQTESQFTNFDRLQREFYESIDAVEMNGQIVCRSVDARARGCQPLNLFGAGIASQEAIDYSYIYTVRDDVTRQWNAVASVNGELFSYPSLFSGTSLPVAFAAGVEWRKEYARSVPDLRSQQGLIFQNAQQITEGRYESKEIFGEINVPLLADVPFVQYLDLTAAYRYQDYTTTGGDSSYGVGLEWTVDRNIRFRGNFAKAVRAPNINELFGGGSEGYSQIEDPCDATRVNLGNFSSNRRANCAALGLSPDFVQSTATRPVVSQGNPDLAPEEGETLTLGVVLTPTFLPGLAVTVDHYDIKMSDVIASLGWRNIINNCVDSPDLNNPFCTSVSRGSDGNITRVLNQVLNVAEYTNSGWDVTASYRTDLAKLGLPDYGSLSFNAAAGFLEDLTYDPVPGDASVRDEQAGELPNPKRRMNFRVTWDYDRVSVSYANQYLSSMVRSNQDQPGTYEPYKAPSWLTHDIRAEYRFDRFSVFAGVNNFTNEEPPQTPFTWTGTSLNTGFNASIYNNLGRYAYIGMNAKF